MARKKKGDTFAKRNAGLAIIFVVVFVMIISFATGGLWILNMDYPTNINIQNPGEIIGGSLNAGIADITDADSVFNDNYFEALNVLSDSVSFGTVWLEICDEEPVEINGKKYSRVCSDEFSSTKDIINSLNKYVSTEYISELMGDNFIDKDGHLYVIPVYVAKDANYVGFSSYRITQQTPNKIIYMVKSKYSELNCDNNCNYDYKEHRFALIRERNKWVVSEFEMPY